ncbi:MAG: DNA-protecting protein DprA, partial [Gammaproteobacteria bacterium]|nr:DNA-protecting protein DprA [Gammaproteobacteria bacterium]
GCHQLIRQGAKLVETAQDIIEELAPLLALTPQPAVPAEAPPPQIHWDPEYQRLLASLDYHPLPKDWLIERSGLTAGEVSSMLLLLELEGYVSSTPGKGFCLTPKYDRNAVN